MRSTVDFTAGQSRARSAARVSQARVSSVTRAARACCAQPCASGISRRIAPEATSAHAKLRSAGRMRGASGCSRSAASAGSLRESNAIAIAIASRDGVPSRACEGLERIVSSCLASRRGAAAFAARRMVAGVPDSSAASKRCHNSLVPACPLATSAPSSVLQASGRSRGCISSSRASAITDSPPAARDCSA